MNDLDLVRGLQNLLVEKTQLESRLKAAELQISEAMKACPWALHEKNHTEPKHCIAALACLLEAKAKEMVREALAEKPKEESPGVFCLDHRKVMVNGICPKCWDEADPNRR
jgi:hypothetical protein